MGSMFDDNEGKGKQKLPDNIAKRKAEKERGTCTPVSATIKIDWDAVKKLCKIMCTKKEIAGFLGVACNTLDYHVLLDGEAANWNEFNAEHSAGGKISIRHMQYQVAMRGNVPMLIWLGKQALNQNDKSQIAMIDEKEQIEYDYDLASIPDKDLAKLKNILHAARH